MPRQPESLAGSLGGQEGDASSPPAAQQQQQQQQAAATQYGRLYDRRWDLTFVSARDYEDPEAEFVVFHFEQRGVSLAFTIIVLLVTIFSVVTRSNVQTDWLIGMIIAWIIWGGCLAAMVYLVVQRRNLLAATNDAISETLEDEPNAAEMTAQQVMRGATASSTTSSVLTGSPRTNNGGLSTSNHVDDPYFHTRRAAAQLPLLQRTTDLQTNAQQWEYMLLLCCAATLCFSISLFLGKDNCIQGDDVDPAAKYDTCYGAIQFDAAFLVIYIGAAVLLQVRIKLFTPVLLVMNIIFFAIRSSPQVPGVPTLVREIVASYAMISFVQTCLCLGVVYVRERQSRDYFETSQRLQYHTLRLAKLRNETERDVKKLCPTDAAKAAGEGHGLFRASDRGVVAVFHIDGLAAWSSLRAPTNAIDATNRFIEVLDGLRTLFTFKPCKYDALGDMYVVMDRVGVNGFTADHIIRHYVMYALFATSESNIHLAPLILRDAFLPGPGGWTSHTSCIESRNNAKSRMGGIRLCASVEVGRVSCRYSRHTENIVIVGEAYERALDALRTPSECTPSDVPLHMDIDRREHVFDDEVTSLESQRRSTIIAASVVVSGTVLRVLNAPQAANGGARRVVKHGAGSTNNSFSNPGTDDGGGGGTAAANHSHHTATTLTGGGVPGSQNPLRPPLGSYTISDNEVGGLSIYETKSINTSSGFITVKPIYRFVDISEMFRKSLNENGKWRRDVKQMSHDSLITDVPLQWVMVLLSPLDGGRNFQKAAQSMSGSASGARNGGGGGDANRSSHNTNPGDDTGTHPNASDSNLDDKLTNDEQYDALLGTTGTEAEVGDSVVDRLEAEFHYLPTMSFELDIDEAEYLYWARGPLHVDLLLVSYTGCLFTSIALICVCFLYKVESIHDERSPMLWIVLSTAAAFFGFVFSVRRFIHDRTSFGNQSERMLLTFLYYVHAATVAASVYVSERGSSALGNGQLLWLWALFGISMSRPQWFGPLLMSSLDIMTALSFLVIGLIFPYRTSEFRTTHVFLFCAQIIIVASMRYVMENARRNAFITENRVWGLSEQLIKEYDEMKVTLQRVTPRFLGDQLLSALRNHHIEHPESYGMMCNVMTQLAFCAVFELLPTDAYEPNREMRMALAINNVLEFVRGEVDNGISPLKVDGHRIILCSGVATLNHKEQIHQLMQVEKLESERAHQFLRCCHHIVHDVLPQSTDNMIHSRCFLTCGPMIGGVLGTGRLCFNFYGAKFATAIQVLTDTPWNGVNHLIADHRVVEMQQVTEDDAKVSNNFFATARNQTSDGNNDYRQRVSNTSVMTLDGTGGSSTRRRSSRASSGIRPHGITFSAPSTIQMRGFPPLAVQYALPPQIARCETERRQEVSEVVFAAQ